MSRRRIVAASIVVAVAFVGSVPARAQDIGILGGINFASLTTGGFTGGGSGRTGLTVGVEFTKPLGDKAKLVIEGLFSQSGKTFKAFVHEPSTGDLIVHLTSIDVPVLAGFGVGGHVTVLAGLVFGLGVGRTETVRMTGVADQPLSDSDALTKKGLNTGIGLGAQFRMNRAFIQVLYNLGLTNLYARSGADQLSVKSHAVSVTAGFSPGKK